MELGSRLRITVRVFYLCVRILPNSSTDHAQHSLMEPPCPADLDQWYFQEFCSPQSEQMYVAVLYYTNTHSDI